MRAQQRRRSGWAAVLAALLLGTGAWAQGSGGVSGAASAALGNAVYATVTVNGRSLFELTAGNGLSASDRADRVSRRLRVLIDRVEPVRPFAPADVEKRGPDYAVKLGGDPILEVTPADAEDNLSDARALALNWGRQMSDVVLRAREARTNPIRGTGILVHDSIVEMYSGFVTWLPRLVATILVWLLFFFLARGSLGLTRAVLSRTPLDPNLRQLVRALAYYGIWMFGVVAMLSVLGMNTASIAAAIGVSGFVIGFAFKDILSHFLAGLLLLVGRQFHIGDQIVIQQYEGTVERIELRALFLRTYDNRLVIIPNADVFTSVVTSNTASPHRRREFVVPIQYDEDVQKAIQVALEAVKSTEGVMEKPEADVLVDDLTSSTINLRVRFYARSLRADYLQVGSAVMCRVKSALEKAGIELPGAAQEIIIDNLKDLRGGMDAQSSNGRGPAPQAEQEVPPPQAEQDGRPPQMEQARAA